MKAKKQTGAERKLAARANEMMAALRRWRSTRPETAAMANCAEDIFLSFESNLAAQGAASPCVKNNFENIAYLFADAEKFVRENPRGN